MCHFLFVFSSCVKFDKFSNYEINYDTLEYEGQQKIVVFKLYLKTSEV